MNKNNYIVITEEVSGKFISYTIKIHGSQNLCSVLAGIKGIKTANICDTKREAERIADFWNECYKKNGTHLYY